MFERAQTKFSTLWRIADIVCALLVVFYILFEVLDLDGSDTYRVVAQAGHSAMVAEADSEFRIDDSLELRDLGIAPHLIAAHLSSQFSEPLQATALAFPLSASERSHGGRRCHPEPTSTDAAPDH